VAETRESADRDRGAATVLSAVVCIALLTVMWLGIELCCAVIVRNRAEGTVDLAALAAAAYAPHGEEFACSRAEWVARSMRTPIVSCRLEDWDAQVEVRADPGGILSELGTANVRARAGPAER
jgi:secretion/DNA translocation related TadE-like protein